MEINMPLDSSKNSKKLITQSSLIYDEVNINVPIYKDYIGTEFYDKKLLDDLKPLENKGIIKLREVNISNINTDKNDKIISSIWHCEELRKLSGEHEFLYSQFDSKGYNDQALLQLDMLQNLETKLKCFDFNKKQEYLEDFLKVIMISGHPGHYMLREHKKTKRFKGEVFRDKLINNIDSIKKSLTPGYRAPITGSRRLEDLAMLQLKIFHGLISENKPVIVNDLLNVALNEINQNHREFSNELKLEALKISLPNYSELDFEDIIRLRETKEFEKMRRFVDRIAAFSADENGLKEAKEYINENVSPKIAELGKRVEGLSFVTRQNVLDDLKNPRNYAPLFATLIPDTSMFIGPTVAALGLLAFQHIDKYLNQKIKNEKDDLFFTVKFPNMVCKKN